MRAVLQIIFCFIATSCFSMLFDAPRRAVPYCGLIGTLAYAVYLFATHQGAGLVTAVLLGSTVTGMMSEYMARRQRMPAIVFITAGIIPLVPGASAYYTMYYFSVANYEAALTNASMVLYVASAISAGLAIGSVLRRR